MKNILFLNDYSEHAKYIFQYALRVGQHFGATINAAHILDVSLLPLVLMEDDSVINEPYYTTNIQKWSEEKFEEETIKLQSFIVQQTPKQSHSLIGDFHIREGDTVTEILDIIKKEKIDLVVLGMNQQNKLANALFGNLSLKMIDKAPCPVLLVPRKAAYLGIDDIAFAVDFNNHDLASIQYMIEWARAFQARLHVIHAALSYSDYAHAVEDVEKWKDHYYKEITAGEIKFYFLIGDEEEKIEGFASEIDADLMCLSTHIRGVWAHLLEPSITKDVARKVEIPILVIKPSK